MKSLYKRFLDETGSATVEFVLLAIPLFIPLFIFANQYALHSDIESSIRIMGRAMARAYVQSENDESAAFIADNVFRKSGEILGLREEISSGEITYEIECKEIPCISPDNEVRIKISTQTLSRAITSLEYVSPWS